MYIFRVIIGIAREREAVWSSRMVMCICMNSMYGRRAMIIFVGKRERHLPSDIYNNHGSRLYYRHVYDMICTSKQVDFYFLYHAIIIQRVSSFVTLFLTVFFSITNDLDMRIEPHMILYDSLKFCKQVFVC